MWILIIMIWSYDGLALTNVPGFKSAEDCGVAGKAASEISKETYRFVCVKQP